MNNDNQDPIKAHARIQAARRRVGVNAKCDCGETRPQALQKKVTCGECDRTARGKTPFDHHHVAGKNNSCATVSVPVNDHRAELSAAQYDWPKDTLENKRRSPLVAAAGCIRGFVDFIYWLVRKLLGWIPPFLEAIDECLVKLFGSQWWTSPEFKASLSGFLYEKQ